MKYISAEHIIPLFAGVGFLLIALSPKPVMMGGRKQAWPNQKLARLISALIGLLALWVAFFLKQP